MQLKEYRTFLWKLVINNSSLGPIKLYRFELSAEMKSLGLIENIFHKYINVLGCALFSKLSFFFAKKVFNVNKVFIIP